MVELGSPKPYVVGSNPTKCDFVLPTIVISRQPFDSTFPIHAGHKPIPFETTMSYLLVGSVFQDNLSSKKKKDDELLTLGLKRRVDERKSERSYYLGKIKDSQMEKREDRRKKDTLVSAPLHQSCWQEQERGMNQLMLLDH